MTNKQPIKIARDIYCIDGFDLQQPERTGTYVIDERKNNSTTIIETGPSISIPHIKEGLKKLGISLTDIKYIILTHIHLDHAGGAGLLLTDCPKAKVIVHPRGERHLQEPSRLIESSRMVYGDLFDQLFLPILPISKESLMVMNHLDKIQLSQERSLIFYDTPGHARHHLSIYESLEEIFFTGDTLGIRYPDLERRGIPFFIPSTSPNQFDPEAMLQSLNLVESMQPKQIAFGHFGTSNEPEKVYQQVRKWLPIFLEKGKEALKNNKDFHALVELIMAEIKKELSSFNLQEDDPIFKTIEVDVKISSMGILDYLQRD